MSAKEYRLKVNGGEFINFSPYKFAKRFMEIYLEEEGRKNGTEYAIEKLTVYDKKTNREFSPDEYLGEVIEHAEDK